jgi:hypothetical protein
MAACACGSENCLHCGQAMLLSSDSDCRKLKDAFLQPVHIVNELVTPEVDYDSWKEFVELVYLVQDVFCNLLAEAVQQEFQTDHMSPVHIISYPSSPPFLKTYKRNILNANQVNRNCK